MTAAALFAATGAVIELPRLRHRRACLVCCVIQTIATAIGVSTAGAAIAIGLVW